MWLTIIKRYATLTNLVILALIVAVVWLGWFHDRPKTTTTTTQRHEITEASVARTEQENKVTMSSEDLVRLLDSVRKSSTTSAGTSVGARKVNTKEVTVTKDATGKVTGTKEKTTNTTETTEATDSHVSTTVEEGHSGETTKTDVKEVSTTSSSSNEQSKTDTKIDQKVTVATGRGGKGHLGIAYGPAEHQLYGTLDLAHYHSYHLGVHANTVPRVGIDVKKDIYKKQGFAFIGGGYDFSTESAYGTAGVGVRF